MATILKRTAPEPDDKRKEGSSPAGDAWLHPEVFDPEYERHTNREIRKLKSVSKGIYVDLKKAQPKSERRLDTAKLVKRPVQVKGKNGKIFTRMQWVDPHTGQPPGRYPKASNEPEFHPQPHPMYKVKHATRPISSKDPEDMTRSEYIDWYIRKKLNREQQYQLIKKHGITWKRNDHESIDHKNAIVALKKFIHENPHHIGAEHKTDEKVSGNFDIDNVDDFWRLWEKDHIGQYKLMKKLGIADKDPRLGVDENNKTAKALAGMAHMRNVMSLKRYLNDNKHIMKDPENLPNTNAGSTHSKRVEKERSGIKPSTAEKGGNDINGVLGRMSSDRVYELMRMAGIADRDPRLDPHQKPNMAALAHYRYMIMLRKHLELNPHLLNKSESGGLSKDERERIASLPDKEKERDRIKSFVKDMDHDTFNSAWESLKDMIYEKLDDRYDSSKLDNPHEGIANMHRKSAIRELFEMHPELMEEYNKDVENQRLLKLGKIGNKTIRSFLTKVVGLKGIGDVTRPEDEELRDIEWQFHDGLSSARVEINSDGNAVLNIIDTGKDGKDWNEFEVPLTQLRDWLHERKSGSQSGMVAKRKEKPLHEKPIDQIEQALVDNFDANYNDKVGEVMKSHIAKAWKAANKTEHLETMAIQTNKMTTGTIKKLLNRWGISVDNFGNGNRIDVNSDHWKSIAYKDDIDTTKKRNAWDYIDVAKRKGQSDDPYVLIESAKKWTSEERDLARRELLNRGIHVDSHIHKADHNHRMRAIEMHFHKALKHIPMSLLAYTMASDLKLSITSKDINGNIHTGGSYSSSDHTCRFDTAYYEDDSVHKDHPMDHRPKSKPHHSIPNATYGNWDFNENIVHEVGHAIDAIFSNNRDGIKWDSDIAKRHVPPEHINIIPESFTKKVNDSNPSHELDIGGPTGSKYMFIKDNWISNYEGKLYGVYQKTGVDPRAKDYVGINGDKMYDKQFLNGMEGDHGSEHWTESLTAYINAKSAYELFTTRHPSKAKLDKYNTLDKWAESTYNEMRNKGLVEDYDRDDNSLDPLPTKRKSPISFAGWKYHALKSHSPRMYEGLSSIFDDNDFPDHRDKH